MICQVSRFVRLVGLQIFQDEESFHSAGRENGPSVMRNGLYIFKTHQTGNQFQISFFISGFEITLIFMRGEFVGFYIDIHLFLKQFECESKFRD